MTFTETTKAELAKPLNKAHVKPPAPGKYGDYIEGWRVIDEANRIFGFDGWTRETVEMIETNREQKGDKAHVGYRCKVRITAGGIVREGSGFGSGVSKQLGDAIESAVKEAETDAMKRALMTFGNPFGLALYDKSHANVQEMAPEIPADIQGMIDEINAKDTQPLLHRWWLENQSKVPEAHSERVLEAVNKRLEQIKTMDRSRAA